MDTKQVRQIADTEVKKHEKRMHKMAKGGKTNDMMKQYGRGMAKVVNQRGSARGK